MADERALDEARRRIKQQRRRAQRTTDLAEHAELATLLNNLSADLWDRQRIGEALEPVDEALGIWRRLVEQNPVLWRPELARSLRNRARFLAKLARYEDAVVTQRELTEQLRLAALQDLRQIPALSEAFDLLGSLLFQLGRGGDAVLELERKVSVCIELAVVDRARVGPHLATALSTLGFTFGDAGRHDDAIHAARQAVEIFRDCAGSELEAVMSQRGWNWRQAFQLYYPESSRDPAARKIASLDGGQAGALYLLGKELGQIGQHDAALEPTEKAVAIFRRLSRSFPDDFGSGSWLASALDTLAATLTALGRHDAADTVRDERRTVPGGSSPP